MRNHQREVGDVDIADGHERNGERLLQVIQTVTLVDAVRRQRIPFVRFLWRQRDSRL